MVETTGLAPALAGPGSIATLNALLEDRARALGDATVLLEYRADGQPRPGLSFRQLYLEAEHVARHLAGLPADRPLTVLSVHGARDFLVGFFGILLARRIAVPTFPPLGRRQQDRSAGILAQPQIGAILTESVLLDAFEASASPALPRLCIGKLSTKTPAPARPETDAPKAGDLALIQFTSGSTSKPRGVRLTHRNLLANLGAIRRRLELDFGCGDTLVSWLPPYHDMGLVAKFLNAIYLGARLVWMPPSRFLRRPLAWLELISEHGAALSAAPNFAYDLCVDAAGHRMPPSLDLSRWRIALNGAEPIRASTLDRFAARFASAGLRATTLYPGYGLAEAVLAVTGGHPGSGPTHRVVSAAGLRQGLVRAPADANDRYRLVSSGSELDGHGVRILAPTGDRLLGEGEIGEILVSGPSVSDGYHAEDVATAAGRLALPSEAVQYLRTGDLGFLERGELYVTGRIKDLIILHGENHYPQDLEQSAGHAAPELKPDTCCAFSVDAANGEALVLVAAVRGSPEPGRLANVADAIAEALARDHGVRTTDIVLVRAGSIPQTTSGKLQRSLCRTRLLEGGLPILYRSSGDNASADPASADDRLARLVRVINQVSGQAINGVTPETPLLQLGLDSIQRVRLRLALEDEFGLPPETEGVDSHQTIQALLDALPGTSHESIVRKPVDLPQPEFHPSVSDVAFQAAAWQKLWQDYATFQDVTHLRHDSPVQLLRIALALRRHPDIPLDRVVDLATRWLELEQFTGWFIHVPKVRARLADPARESPALWRQLEQLARAVTGPAVVTLFHMSGWDWLLALIVRAATGAGRKIALLYDADVADLTDGARKRFDAFLGVDSHDLQRNGQLALVDLHEASLDAHIHRYLADERWIIVLPDAVHGRRTRPGRVELPLLGGTVRVATGIYQVAADRGLPLVHLPFHFGKDGPVLEPSVTSAEPLAACSSIQQAAVIEQLLKPFLDTLQNHPEQWRQWRLLVPAPSIAVARAPGAALLESERILHLETIAAHWLMCTVSQRAMPLPSEVWHALADARDEHDARARLQQAGVAYPRLDELLHLLAGEDPHRLFL